MTKGSRDPAKGQAPARETRRERPNALAAAAAHGVDIDQLRHAVSRTVDERLRELDANMRFLAELQEHGSQPRHES